jgi:hypothetical protein
VPSLAGPDVREGQEDRAPIAPRGRAAGVAAFVPERYRLKGQWKDFLEARGG